MVWPSSDSNEGFTRSNCRDPLQFGRESFIVKFKVAPLAKQSGISLGQMAKALGNLAEGATLNLTMRLPRPNYRGPRQFD